MNNIKFYSFVGGKSRVFNTYNQECPKQSFIVGKVAMGKSTVMGKIV